jgi:hypothetical protein
MHVEEGEIMEQEMQRWHRKTRVDIVLKNLRKNLFAAHYMENSLDALSLIMNMIPKDATVGLGDSLTLKEMGALRLLQEGGYHYLNPWRKGILREESLALRRQALTSDIFLTGTNAVTMDGKLVSIDGLGNRVAAMIFGPRKVIVVAGVNKIVEDVPEAIRRIKNVAAPVNARKHNIAADIRPPCSDTGYCSECKPPHRLCCNTVIIEGCSRDKERITVVIVGEELGY